MTEIPDGNPPPKRQRGALRTIVIVVAAAVTLLVVLYLVLVNFVVQPYLIPSESMAPTLNPGDRIIVNKATYRFGSPQPGDVIVFTAPPEWSVGYQSIRSDNTAVRWLRNALSVFGFVPPDENQAVKRIIAVGGQTVECRSGTGLTVDGKPVSEPYLNPATMMVDPQVYPCLGPEFGPVKVPDGRLWVMGVQPHALGRLTRALREHALRPPARVVMHRRRDGRNHSRRQRHREGDLSVASLSRGTHHRE